MNCLITSIGSFSGETVLNSLRKNNISNIIGCDINLKSKLSNSSLVDTFYQVPIANDENNYINKIIEIVLLEKINYIIPLTDPEVDVFSIHRLKFKRKNVKICMPSNRIINIVRNKLSFYKYFNKDPLISLIPTYDSHFYDLNLVPYPIVLKKNNGRSSLGLKIINSKKDLKFKINDLCGFVIQPFIDGDFYTVDLIRDKKSNRCFSIPRKELERTIKGAGVKVEISHNNILSSTAEHIGEKLDLNGCINIEFIFKDDKYYLMDINPRFSAGIKFSSMAGYDMIINHLRCFTNEKIQNPMKYEAFKAKNEWIHT